MKNVETQNFASLHPIQNTNKNARLSPGIFIS